MTEAEFFYIHGCEKLSEAKQLSEKAERDNREAQRALDRAKELNEASKITFNALHL